MEFHFYLVYFLNQGQTDVVCMCGMWRDGCSKFIYDWHILIITKSWISLLTASIYFKWFTSTWWDMLSFYHSTKYLYHSTIEVPLWQYDTRLMGIRLVDLCCNVGISYHHWNRHHTIWAWLISRYISTWLFHFRVIFVTYIVYISFLLRIFLLLLSFFYQFIVLAFICCCYFVNPSCMEKLEHFCKLIFLVFI